MVARTVGGAKKTVSCLGKTVTVSGGNKDLKRFGPTGPRNTNKEGVFGVSGWKWCSGYKRPANAYSASFFALRLNPF